MNIVSMVLVQRADLMCPVRVGWKRLYRKPGQGHQATDHLAEVTERLKGAPDFKSVFFLVGLEQNSSGESEQPGGKPSLNGRVCVCVFFFFSSISHKSMF